MRNNAELSRKEGLILEKHFFLEYILHDKC